MLPGEFDIAHIVVSRLWKSFQTTGMCGRRHGEVVLEVRRLQNTDISSYQQKGTGASQLSRWQISFLLPQESRSPEKQLSDSVIGLKTPTDLARVGTAYRPENIQEKDRYRHAVSWCGGGIMINGRTCLHVVANGTMSGQRYIDEVLLPHVRLFRGAVGDKFVLWTTTQHVIEHSLFGIVLDSEGIQRLVWPAFSRSKPPLKMCGMLWGGKFLV
ncbi:hypothetical protein TNCV_4962261 [Trichonephila clavipes]|nr:hypothetical protein TNCV_4962261 [Trichonephila clavipes]